MKNERKDTIRHLALKDLPGEHRFTMLAPVRKQFVDTIKMIAYRAETSMAAILRDKLSRSDDARALVREIITTEADLILDEEKRTLTVQLHHLTNRISDIAAWHLAKQLNKTEVTYPGTNLRLIYKLVSNENPAIQEV